jgi:subtilisin family serine protease
MQEGLKARPPAAEVLGVESRSPVAAAVLAATFLLTATPALAAGTRDGEPDRVVVAFDAATGDGAMARVLDAVDAAGPHALPALDQTVAVTVEDGDAAAAAATLDRAPGVAWAEVDRRARAATALPSGDFLGGPWQWGLWNTGQWIGATGIAGIDGNFPAAWDIEQGATDVPVAVVDTGVDFSIGDLAANRAAGGRDFVADDDDPSPAAPDGAAPGQTSHGTHVAGIAAASPAVNVHGGDITGAAPAAGIMALRALDASGRGWSSDIAAAFAWAAEHGARVVNASLTVDGPSQALADAIAAHPNTLFVAAAGNGDDDARGLDEDRLDASRRAYPCALDLANVLCVAAVDNRGGLAAFSNYGARSVDVGAPGVGVVSYTVGGSLAWWDGTSMAAPYAAAAAELAVARTPTVTAPQLRDAIVSSARSLPALAGRTTSGGMIDASALVARTAALPVVAAPTAPAKVVPAAASVTPSPAAPSPAPAPPAQPLPATAPPTPGLRRGRALRSPALRLARVTHGARLRVDGTAARTVTGTVTIRVCAGRRCAHARAPVIRGRFHAFLRVPRNVRVRITASLPATRGHRAAQISGTARS